MTIHSRYPVILPSISSVLLHGGPSTMKPTSSSTSFSSPSIISKPLASSSSTSVGLASLTTVSQMTRVKNDSKGKGKEDSSKLEIFYRQYRNEEEDLPGIMSLVERELSEPYNHYTFRYFLMDWPNLAFLVFPSETSSEPIATIICKQDSHKGKTNRGYIAMLSVDQGWRRRGIASQLVKMAVEEMVRKGAHEIVLETEYDNEPSLTLYDSLGFLREKRLHRFYSNGKDAFRLILPLPSIPPPPPETEEEADLGRWNVGAGSDTSISSEEEQYFPLNGDTSSGGHRGSPPIPDSPTRGDYDYYS